MQEVRLINQEPRIFLIICHGQPVEGPWKICVHINLAPRLKGITKVMGSINTIRDSWPTVYKTILHTIDSLIQIEKWLLITILELKVEKKSAKRSTPLCIVSILTDIILDLVRPIHVFVNLYALTSQITKYLNN